MIGVVVVTHGRIGEEMVAAVQRIFPDMKHMIGVEVQSDAPPSRMQERVREAIATVRGDRGVLILTDMFGGTPSNICLPFLNESGIEVISGVNMPMLMKLANLATDMSFEELVSYIQRYGQRNIVVASSVLAGDMAQHG